MTPFVGKRLESSERVAVNGASSLAVDVDAGDVTVRSEEREDVAVEVVKQSSSVGVDLSKFEFRVERPEDRVRLRGVWTGEAGLSGGPSMDLDVRVPAPLAVSTAETSTGDVDVSGLELLDATVGEKVASGTIGDGGPTLAFETSTGDVMLTALD